MLQGELLRLLTRSCFLLLLLGRLFLLSLLLRTCLPSFTVVSTLSSRSDPPLSCQGTALAHLGFFAHQDLVLWTDGSVPFPFGKDDSGVLANCFLCGSKTALFFPGKSFFLLQPAPFCTLFAGLDSTNNSAISLFFSSYMILALYSPPCSLLHLFFCLNLSGRSGRNCLLSPPVL